MKRMIRENSSQIKDDSPGHLRFWSHEKEHILYLFYRQPEFIRSQNLPAPFFRFQSLFYHVQILTVDSTFYAENFA
jgi:hypothetical protein